MSKNIFFIIKFYFISLILTRTLHSKFFSSMFAFGNFQWTPDSTHPPSWLTLMYKTLWCWSFLSLFDYTTLAWTSWVRPSLHLGLGGVWTKAAICRYTHAAAAMLCFIVQQKLFPCCVRQAVPPTERNPLEWRNSKTLFPIHTFLQNGCECKWVLQWPPTGKWRYSKWKHVTSTPRITYLTKEVLWGSETLLL